jgi:hypothetical protein
MPTSIWSQSSQILEFFLPSGKSLFIVLSSVKIFGGPRSAISLLSKVFFGSFSYLSPIPRVHPTTATSTATAQAF